jgi:hypothetical protein
MKPKKMKPEDFFKDGRVLVWKEEFSVVKARAPIPEVFAAEAFAVIKDKNEVTVIIEESKVNAKEDSRAKEDLGKNLNENPKANENQDKNQKSILEVEKGWKLLTFDMTLPFELVGFLAKVSQILADAKISIFAISSYSTDHIMVKKKDLPRTLTKLKSLGCSIEQI